MSGGLISKAAPRRGASLLAGLCALTLILAGCTSGGLPEDPQEAVATAVENRFDTGTTVAASLQISDRLMQQADPGDRQILEALTAEQALQVTLDGDQFALAVSLGDGQPIQIRALGEAFYVLADVPSIVEFAGADVQLQQLRQQIGQFSILLGDLAQLVQAALEGNWAGVVEIPDGAGQQLSQLFGAGPTATPTPGATELASELGFTDPVTFVERYLEVEESDEEGTYTATLRLRELIRASTQSADRLGPLPIEPPTGQELQEIPETVEGITIETEGDQISALEADIGAMAPQDGPSPAPTALEAGDAVLSLSFDDVDGELLEEPSDATTITFEQFMSTLGQFAGMFGQSGQPGQPGQSGGGGGQAPAVVPTDLPTGLELPTG